MDATAGNAGVASKGGGRDGRNETVLPAGASATMEAPSPAEWELATLPCGAVRAGDDGGGDDFRDDDGGGDDDPPAVGRYRGGWSTSICGLFQDPARRSDFCAVTCCGVLLMDRNDYLLSRIRAGAGGGIAVGGVRPDWKKRCVSHFAIPLLLVVAISYAAAAAAAGTAGTPSAETASTTASTATLVLQLALLAWVVVMLYKGRVHRSRIRKEVLAQLRLEQAGDTEDEVVTRRAAMMDAENATAVCCSYRKDFPDRPASSSLRDDARPGGDFGTCLWNALATACCAACCGCWLQCCGSCATNQESREIERLLLLGENPGSRLLLQIDYITFQPFWEYYARILDLRRMGPASTLAQEWAAQAGALSELSRHILKWFVGGVAALGVLSALSGGAEGVLSFVVVVVGTTGNAALVLYLVHWKWNRSDISVDAIVKYTAGGFVLAAFMATVVEQCMMAFAVPVVAIFVFLDILSVDTHGVPLDQWVQDPSNLQRMLRDHLGQLIIFGLFFSFIVAALTEELMKYYVYWMTETPDLMTMSELGILPTDAATTMAVDSKVRRARATTVAMVAVATGFAWSENVLYIRGQHSLHNQAVLLFLRWVFPVHQLCAALQSIGVVRRDVELDGRWQLGRSILSAVLLHGAYDFVAIFFGIVLVATKDDDDGSGAGGAPDPAAPIDVAAVLQSLALCAPVVLMGVWYYVVEAGKQRRRLEAAEGYSEVPLTTSALPPTVEDGSGNGHDWGTDDRTHEPLLPFDRER